MVAILEKSQAQPAITLVNTLVRIGELRNCLTTLEQSASKALGLDVQLMSLDAESDSAEGSKFSLGSRGGGFQRLRVIVDSTVRLEAWRRSQKQNDWTALHYESGDWEYRCQPTLRLVRWICEWGGLHPDKQATLQLALDDFKRLGQLILPLRGETGGRLCGVCGEEVKGLEEHLRALHVVGGVPQSLYLYMKEKDGKKSVKISRGRDQDQQVWNIPEELYIPSGRDRSYRQGLAREIDKLFLMGGKCRLLHRNQRRPMPYDVTPFPFMAHIIRTLTP